MEDLICDTLFRDDVGEIDLSRVVTWDALPLGEKLVSRLYIFEVWNSVGASPLGCLLTTWWADIQGDSEGYSRLCTKPFAWIGAPDIVWGILWHLLYNKGKK